MTLYGQQTQQAWEKRILYLQLTVLFRRGAFYLDIPGGQILLGIGLSAKHIGFTVFEVLGEQTLSFTFPEVSCCFSCSQCMECVNDVAYNLIYIIWLFNIAMENHHF